MQLKHRYQLTPEGNLVPKELLIEMILNKESELLQANTYTIATHKSYRIKIKKSPSLLGPLDQPINIEKFLEQQLSNDHPLEQDDRLRLVKALFRQSFSEEMRKKFALVFSGASISQHTFQHYYQSLLQGTKLYPDYYFTGIDKDVPRTFGDNQQLCRRLRNVLCCYAVRNPHVHYCQGMNFLIGYFITHQYTQQQTFWILTYLIEDLLPADYYRDMGCVLSLSSIIKDILNQLLPEFVSFFQKTSLELSAILVPWLISLYTKGLPTQVADFIIVSIMVQGRLALIKAAVAIMKLAGPKVQDPQDFGELWSQVQKNVSQIKLPQFKLFYESIYLNQYFINVLFSSYMTEYESMSEKQDALKASNTENYLPQCNQNLPICLHTMEIGRRFRVQPTAQVQTLRINSPLQQLMDASYFQQSKVIQQPKPKVIDSTDIKKVLIGRCPHICQNKSKVKKTLSLSEVSKIIQAILYSYEQNQQPTSPSEFGQPPTYHQTITRKATASKVLQLRELFQVRQDYKMEHINIVDEVVKQQKQSMLSKKNSLIPVKERSTFNFKGLLKKLF